MMTATTEKAFSHVGESRGTEDRDHDLIHELSRRLDCLWRYDQYIANADGKENLQKFWRDVKAQETKNIEQLKKFVTQHAESGCF